MIILNEVWSTSDTLQDKTDVCSPRPRLVIGQAFRKYRQLQGDQAKMLTMDILTNPEDYMASIARYSSFVSEASRWIPTNTDCEGRRVLKEMAAEDLRIPLVTSVPSWMYTPVWTSIFSTKSQSPSPSIQAVEDGRGFRAFQAWLDHSHIEMAFWTSARVIAAHPHSPGSQD